MQDGGRYISQPMTPLQVSEGYRKMKELGEKGKGREVGSSEKSPKGGSEKEGA